MHADSTVPAQPRHEITLFDIWRILNRRRRWIFASIAIFLIIGAAYLALKEPIYQTSVKIRIGQVAGAGPFEAPESLATRLLAEYGEDVAEGVKRPRPVLRKSIGSKSGPPVVELVTEGYEPEHTAQLLERIAAEVKTQHGEIFERNSKSLNEYMQNLVSQRSALEAAYENSSALLEQLGRADPAQASVVAIERGRMAASIAEIDAQKPNLTRTLSRPATEPTELLGPITAPARPVLPRKSMVAALSLILGVLVGVGLAFFTEFVSRVRYSSGR